MRIVEQEDGTVWIGNPVSMFLLPGWIQAEKSDEYLTITGPQLVYEEYDWDLDDGTTTKYYLTAVEAYQYENEEGDIMQSYRPTEDGVFRFKINGTTLKEEGDGSLILGICGYSESEGYFFTGYGDQYTVMTVPEAKPVEVPASATIHKGWAMRYYDNEDHEGARLVDVAIDGSDYYVRGAYAGLPQTWMKGTRDNDDRIVFPNFQLMGADLNWNYFIYSAGGQMDNIQGKDSDDAVLDSEGFVMYVDDEEGLLEAENNLIFVTSDKTNPENANYVVYYSDVTFTEQKAETFTNPVGPDELFLGGFDGLPAVEFNLLPVDENDNLLDSENLYFSVYVNSKEITFDPADYMDMEELGIYAPTDELPYNIGNGYDFYQEGSWHTVYVYGIDKAAIYNIGIQAIYYPEGRDVNPENVLMSDIIMVGEENDPNSVDSLGAMKQVSRVVYYDLNGCEVTRPAAGIYLKRIEYTDGTVKTLKAAVR